MYCIQYNDVCITLTAMIIENNMHFNCAYTSTTFQKQVSNNKWPMLMLTAIYSQIIITLQ